MKLILSETAIVKLMSKVKSDYATFLLSYDTEGCGCAVNGIPVLRIISNNDLDNYYEVIESNRFTFYIRKRHTIFFEDLMTVDYKNQNLVLASDQQIYTHDLPIKR